MGHPACSMRHPKRWLTATSVQAQPKLKALPMPMPKAHPHARAQAQGDAHRYTMAPPNSSLELFQHR